MTATLKIAALLVWILGCSAYASAAGWLIRSPYEKNRFILRMMQRCFKGVLRIVGIQVTIKGELAMHRPLMLVTNHSSYLDIPVLGAAMPVRFTPKSDIAKWPIIGHLCRQIGCIFIDRRIHKTQDNQGALHTALAGGELICLFPEGTTSDGKRLLPFRSSYFSLAEQHFEEKTLTLQPAAVRYTHVHGLPVDAGLQPKIAWYGDMELLPHLKELLALGPIRAELAFGQPYRLEGIDRKTLAGQCHEDIYKLLKVF